MPALLPNAPLTFCASTLTRPLTCCGALAAARPPLRLWPLLDWDALAALPPKMVVGYSDTTSLLIPLTQRVGTAALHGPLVFELGTLAPDLLDWQLGLLQNVQRCRERAGLCCRAHWLPALPKAG